VTNDDIDVVDDVFDYGDRGSLLYGCLRGFGIGSIACAVRDGCVPPLPYVAAPSKAAVLSVSFSGPV
jgi:hypothetical protein